MIRENGFKVGTYFYHCNEGFYYYKNKTIKGVTYFRCKEAPQCEASVVMRHGIPQLQRDHMHLPDFQFLHSRRAREAIMNDIAQHPTEPLDNIMSPERYPQIPPQINSVSLAPAVNRLRQRQLPPAPVNLPQLATILASNQNSFICHQLLRGEPFYAGSTFGSDGSCILMLLSHTCLQQLAVTQVWFVTTTSVVVTAHETAYQLHTVISDINNRVIPLMWLLMDKRTLHSLQAGLLLLRTKLGQWQPHTIMCPLGVEAEAYRTVFTSNVQHTLQDFVQDVCTAAQAMIPHQTFVQPDVMDMVQLIAVLPTLPPERLLTEWGTIVGNSQTVWNPTHHHTAAFLHYMYREWIGHTTRGPILSAFGNAARTSTGREVLQDMYIRFEISINKDLYDLIRKLSKIEEKSANGISQLQHGLEPTALQRSTCLSRDKEIVALSRALLDPCNPPTTATKNLLTTARAKLQRAFQQMLHQ